jgi:hypothetical protein
MQINVQQLRTIMKESGMEVFRDQASTTADYPYVIYEFVNETHKRSSSKVYKSMPLYQVAVITNGTEADYEPLKDVFNAHGVEFSQFDGLPYDENDSTITQFITYVRCVN